MHVDTVMGKCVKILTLSDLILVCQFDASHMRNAEREWVQSRPPGIGSDTTLRSQLCYRIAVSPREALHPAGISVSSLTTENDFKGLASLLQQL